MFNIHVTDAWIGKLGWPQIRQAFLGEHKCLAGLCSVLLEFGVWCHIQYRGTSCGILWHTDISKGRLKWSDFYRARCQLSQLLKRGFCEEAHLTGFGWLLWNFHFVWIPDGQFISTITFDWVVHFKSAHNFIKEFKTK